MPAFGNSQNLVDIEDIRESTIILKDGGLRQVLMVGGVNFSLKSEEEQNMLTQSYQNFLNSIDFPLQIIIHSRKINAGKYLEELDRRGHEEPSPLLQSQIAEYREFIRQFTAENAIMEKSFLAVVPWVPIQIPHASGMKKFLPFLGKAKTPAETAAAADPLQELLLKSLPQLSQRVNQVTQGLQGIGLDVVLLGNEELVELFYNFYNPESVERTDVAVPNEK